MSHYNTVFNELLKLVPRHEFENAVYKHNGDYRIRKMSCWNHFATLLYAQISGKDSLRDIETGINAQSPKLYHLGMKEVRRSTLSDANNNRPHEIYEQIFGKTLNRIYGVTTKHKFKFSNLLFTLDATTIDLCLEVFPWAKFRKAKGAIKMHTLFDNSGYFPSVVVVTDGKVHDSKVAKELPSDVLQADSIILVDKAYIDFSWLYNLALNKCYFVTRAKDNMDYVSIGQHNEACPEKGLIADQAWVATGGKSRIGVLTYGAQPEPPTGAKEQPPDEDGHRHDGIDQRIESEERGIEAWQIGQSRQENPWQPTDLGAYVRLADQRAGAEAKEHQRQTAGQLVGPTVDHEIAQDHVHRSTGQHGHQHTEVWIARCASHSKASGSADQQHPLQPQIDNARALIDDLTQGGIEKGSSGEDGAGENAEKGQQAHALFPSKKAGRARTTNSVNASRMLMTA